jgi:hypothetical protein
MNSKHSKCNLQKIIMLDLGNLLSTKVNGVTFTKYIRFKNMMNILGSIMSIHLNSSDKIFRDKIFNLKIGCMILMQGVIATLTLGSQPRFGGHNKKNEPRMRSTYLHSNTRTHKYVKLQ